MKMLTKVVKNICNNAYHKMCYVMDDYINKESSLTADEAINEIKKLSNFEELKKKDGLTQTALSYIKYQEDVARRMIENIKEEDDNEE